MNDAIADIRKKIAELQAAGLAATEKESAFKGFLRFLWAIFKSVSLIVLFWGLVPVTWVTRGWALHRVWVWFVTPTWGIAAPNPLVLLGLVSLLGLLTFKGFSKADEEEQAKPKTTWFHLKVMLVSVFAPLVCVGMLWIMRAVTEWGMVHSSWVRYFMETGLLW
jgi:hypothetical protein